MIVYKCPFSDSELFTEVQKPCCDDECAFQVKAKVCSRKIGFDDAAIGANKSAEEQEEECEDAVESGLDLVLNSRLRECGYGDKKQLLAYIKQYLKSLQEKLTEKAAAKGAPWTDEQINAFKTRAKKFFLERVVPEWKEFQFFHGENDEDFTGTCVFIKYDDTGMAADVLIFKDGVEETKY